jgi:hypothetical protein
MCRVRIVLRGTNLVLNADGITLPAILHHYDRDKELTEIMNSRTKEWKREFVKQFSEARGTDRKTPQARLAQATAETTRMFKLSRHQPNYFTEHAPLEILARRGNFIRDMSGCRMASWYDDRPRTMSRTHDDCIRRSDDHRQLQAVDQIQLHDTVYVPIKKLVHFVQNVLPEVKVDFVLISGQQQNSEPFSRHLFNQVLGNKHVMHWFLMNLETYAYDMYHPKVSRSVKRRSQVYCLRRDTNTFQRYSSNRRAGWQLSPFPYGLKRDKINLFAREFKRSVEKDNRIFVSYLEPNAMPKNMMRPERFRARATRRYKTDAWEFRIPSGEKMEYVEYLQMMHRSQYVLSPNGDRTDCFRHYEAIGLGTVPITELDPTVDRHLAVSSVVADNTSWNLTELEESLPKSDGTNRRIVFEEYWMEYVEEIAMRPLRWWDDTAQKHGTLAEMASASQ